MLSKGPVLALVLFGLVQGILCYTNCNKNNVDYDPRNSETFCFNISKTAQEYKSDCIVKYDDSVYNETSNFLLENFEGEGFWLGDRVSDRNMGKFFQDKTTGIIEMKQFNEHCYKFQKGQITINNCTEKYRIVCPKLDDVQMKLACPENTSTSLHSDRHCCTAETNEQEQESSNRSCSQIKKKTPTLHLKYNKDTTNLELTVEHRDYFFHFNEDTSYGIHCYSIFNIKLRKITELKHFPKLDKVIYSVQIDGNFPKYYWCQGVTLDQKLTIKSNLEIAYKPQTKLYFTIFHPNPIPDIEKIVNRNYETDEISKYSPDISIYHKVRLGHITNKTPKYILEKKRNLVLEPRKGVMVRSADYCFTEDLNNSIIFDSMYAKIGEVIISNVDCVNSKNQLFSRQCIGNEIIGAYWEDPKENETCAFPPVGSMRKDFDINQPNTVLHWVHQMTAKTSRTSRNLQTFHSALNKLMDIKDDVLDKVLEVDPAATNKLLINYDREFDQDSNNVKDISEQLNAENNQMVELTFQPMMSNISGLVVYRKDNEYLYPRPRKNYRFEFIYRNQTTDQVLGRHIPGHHLVIGALVTDAMCRELAKISSKPLADLRVKVTVFFTGKLHHSIHQNQHADMVFRLSIPGYSEELPDLLQVFFARRNESVAPCVYYDLNVNMTSYTPMGWSSEGCSELDHANNATVILCGCTHLSHFSSLLNGLRINPQFKSESSIAHHKFLNSITYTCIILSFFGIALIFLTAIKLRQWHKVFVNQCYTQMTVAVALQLIFFVIADKALIVSNRVVCALIGGVLQYSTLVIFVWMFIVACRILMAFHMQTDSTTHDRRLLLKLSLCAWGLPLIPSVFGMAIFPSMYQSLQGNLCYPHGNVLYFGVILPIATIVLMNLVIYTMARIRMVRVANRLPAGRKKLNKIQRRINTSFFLYLGLTYIFGFIAEIPGFEDNIATLFIYIFSVLAPLQGFFLFLDAVLMNPEVRYLWWRMVFSKKQESSGTMETPVDS